MQQVHWYPGHIHKTRKELEQKIKQIDTLIILVDARAPFSSFIPSFESISNNKNVLIIISKIDFVSKNQLTKAINFFKNKNYQVLLINLKNKNKQSLQKIINALDKFKYKKPIPKIMIIGVPNVGKSSLINMILSKNRTKVENRAGVTRQTNWYSFEKYYLLDTPGILEASYLDINTAYKLALIGSIKLNILPLHQLREYLLEIYNIKNNDELNIYLSKSTKKTQKEKDLDLLQKFQKGHFKFNYLDDFNKDFETEIETEN